MTKEQFIAYNNAKMLERFIHPANDNAIQEGQKIYTNGLFDGLMAGSLMAGALALAAIVGVSWVNM